MDIRSLQKPFKEKYRADPSASRITLRASGSQSAAPVACSVDIGRAVYEAQAHAGVGGPGTAACSGDWAQAASAPSTKGTSTCAALSDFHGKSASRFEQIRLRFDIEAPSATDDQIRALREKTEQYCVVIQTLASPTEIHVSWK
jgi:OsmC-like protein